MFQHPHLFPKFLCYSKGILLQTVHILCEPRGYMKFYLHSCVTRHCKKEDELSQIFTIKDMVGFLVYTQCLFCVCQCLREGDKDRKKERGLKRRSSNLCTPGETRENRQNNLCVWVSSTFVCMWSVIVGLRGICSPLLGGTWKLLDIVFDPRPLLQTLLYESWNSSTYCT